MCTLTYRLTKHGYQLFFNRDEQTTRAQAIPPTYHKMINAIYPVDPLGGGTWIAVEKSGLSLALLNYYQGRVNPLLQEFTSRGVIIPYLLMHKGNLHEQLCSMDFSCFQAFQLCVFEADLSAQSGQQDLAKQYIWDGTLFTCSTLLGYPSLPITSSSVDYEDVYAYRKHLFTETVSETNAKKKDFIQYHQQQGSLGSYSVKMQRKEAKTVSFTAISVKQSSGENHKVSVEYLDYLTQQSSVSDFIPAIE